jgi:hypothetical protein
MFTNMNVMALNHSIADGDHGSGYQCQSASNVRHRALNGELDNDILKLEHLMWIGSITPKFV